MFKSLSLACVLLLKATNGVALADDDTVDLFEEMKQTGDLNNSLLVFMTDHGQR